jgi:hypothetical protein
MNTISITYTLKYQLHSAPHYQFTTDKQCFNVKTGRRIKQTYVSGCIGYCINGKFRSLKSLRTELELIPKENNLLF